MRVPLVWLLLFAASARAQAEDDDPKAPVAQPQTLVAQPQTIEVADPAQGDSTHAVTHDDDDPKGARAPALHKKFTWKIAHHVPRVKLAYRNFTTIGLEKGVDLPFHIIELDYYPSSGYLRFGLDTEVGINGGKYDAWFLTTGAALGFQYPARVTPFLEARFVAGLMGGTAQNTTAVSYTYMGGIDSGIELYVGGRFYLTASIGWVHPVYSAVDIDWVKAHPKLNPARKEFASDAFTFKVGLGL